MSTKPTTIVILGGGPAGCAVAIALRERGLGPVFIVESGSYARDRVGESAPPDLRELLDRLGLLAAFEREGHEACQGSCSSWGDDSLGYNDFVFNPHGAGFHLDRRRFDLFMARSAIAAGARVLTNTRFRAARPLREHDLAAGFVLELETESEVREVAAGFVVDATGSGARFAVGRGATRRMHDHMFCATAYFQLRPGARLSQLTLLEAEAEGWWYAARLPDRRVAVALACDGPQLKAKALHEPRAWLERLSETRHLAPWLADCFMLPGSLSVCPIPCFVLDRAAGPSWLAVGDAASSFDPLSAQGIHKALSTGLIAAETIAQTLAGEPEAGSRYADAIDELFASYRIQRDEFYAREQRWPESEFWQRRRDAPNHGLRVNADQAGRLRARTEPPLAYHDSGC